MYKRQAFILGWKFSLVVLLAFPIIMGAAIFLILILQTGYKKQERAFKKSSTLAEQALSSFKVVAAFGQEEKEEERFNEPLEDARRRGVKFHTLSSLAYALNNGAFILAFAVVLFFGAIFVIHKVHNDVQGRNYTPGDIIAIFFGMIFAAFSLSLAGPNFKSLTVGRQAAYAALETINREPQIQIDDQRAISMKDMRGEIKFDNVTFRYKS